MLKEGMVIANSKLTITNYLGKTMKKLLTLGLFLFTTIANASIVYDNGLPDTTNGHSILNNNKVKDEFILSDAATISSIGFYFQNYNGITGWNQDVAYNFYSSNSTLIASGSGQNVVAVDSGLNWCCGGGNAWLVTFNLESTLSLTSGDYFLELTGATGTATSAWWVTSNGQQNEHAFYLEGNTSPVPVPAAVWLLGTGLIGLISMRRKV